MLELDTVLLVKELLAPAAGWPGLDCPVAEPVCPSSLSPAANGNKSLELTGSSVGLAQPRGATQKTALGSPSAESALSFLSSLYWGVETQASLLPIYLRERRM